MTSDSQNIYNSLFSYLRKDLSPQKEDVFLHEAKQRPEVMDDLKTFSTAQVLFAENDLLHFKQTAKAYAKQQALIKKRIKIATISAALIAGSVSYLLINQTDDHTKQTQHTIINLDTITHTTPEPITSITTSHNKTTTQEVRETESLTKLTLHTDKNHTHKSTINANEVPSIIKEGASDTPADDNNTKTLEKETETTKTNAVGPTVHTQEKITDTTNKTSTTDKIISTNTKKETKNKKTENSEQKNNTIPSNTEYVAPKTTIEDSNPCVNANLNTFEPLVDDHVVLIDKTIDEGSIIIYNELVKVVYQYRFDTNKQVDWDGKDLHGEYVSMGLYKIITTYRNGKKCIHDLTILRR